MTAPEQPTPEALTIATRFVGNLRGRDRVVACAAEIDELAAQRAAEAVSEVARQHDEQVDRLKACEHIAEGDEGWEKLRNICPSTAAVASLRDALREADRSAEDWRQQIAATPPPGDARERARRLVNEAGPLHSPSPWHIVGSLDAAAQAIAAFAQSERTAAASQRDEAVNQVWALRQQISELTAAASQARRETRDARQNRVSEWCIAAFGIEHSTSLPQRGCRLLEEAIEAYQAAGASAEMAHRLVDYVFGRPVGELGQELGGVAIGLLALAAAAGLSAEGEEVREFDRVLSKPLAQFTARNEAKNAAGFRALANPQESA